MRAFKSSSDLPCSILLANSSSKSGRVSLLSPVTVTAKSASIPRIVSMGKSSGRVTEISFSSLGFNPISPSVKPGKKASSSSRIQ